jgi:hypothetical protein
VVLRSDADDAVSVDPHRDAVSDADGEAVVCSGLASRGGVDADVCGVDLDDVFGAGLRRVPVLFELGRRGLLEVAVVGAGEGSGRVGGGLVSRRARGDVGHSVSLDDAVAVDALVAQLAEGHAVLVLREVLPELTLPVDVRRCTELLVGRLPAGARVGVAGAAVVLSEPDERGVRAGLRGLGQLGS